ncbi:MAG: putative bacteriocin export ABC transporter [Firmicutes bacterium]|nr:putative bacteriocin export ABC transporter [Bacillota bacterium]
MEPIIKLKDISKKFGDQVILKNINLEIPRGSMTAIVGESGSGKTTLLNIIGLLEKADRGKLIIDEETINDKYVGQKTRYLRSKINYLFQNFALIDNQTVDYNLDIGLKYVNESIFKKEEMKKKILAKVGLEGFGNKKVFQLSGGEQQRVSIARALLKPCEVILADEPTGSLDDRNASMILDFLHTLNKQGKTILIVTHNLEVAKECNQIIKITMDNLISSSI